MYAAFADAEIEERHVIGDVQDAPSEVAREILKRLERGDLVPS
jgi:hypothetical protein